MRRLRRMGRSFLALVVVLVAGAEGAKAACPTFADVAKGVTVVMKDGSRFEIQGVKGAEIRLTHRNPTQKDKDTTYVSYGGIIHRRITTERTTVEFSFSSDLSKLIPERQGQFFTYSFSARFGTLTYSGTQMIRFSETRRVTVGACSYDAIVFEKGTVVPQFRQEALQRVTFIPALGVVVGWTLTSTRGDNQRESMTLEPTEIRAGR